MNLLPSQLTTNKYYGVAEKILKISKSYNACPIIIVSNAFLYVDLKSIGKSRERG